MILIEVTAAVDEFGTLQTFYLTTKGQGFQTSPTDTPANTVFDDDIINPGFIGLSAFSDGRTEGASRLETGDIQIANANGDYDAWKDHSFDGRPLVIRREPTNATGGAYPADFPVIFTGVVEAVIVGLTDVTIRIKDKAAVLDLPLLTTKYAGTNVGPTGLEGTADDLKGRVKPRVYGRVFNVAPPCANTSKLTFQVSDRAVAAIGAVYDKGLALDFGVDHANSAALTAATIASGDYDTCLAEGLFRLGSSPQGIITADVDEKVADFDMTPGELLARIATDAGLLAGEVSADDIGELNAEAPYVLGLYVEDERSAREAMDRIAGSVGAWYGFDAAGVLRAAVLRVPGEPVADLIEADLLRGFERGVADRNGVPVWRVTVRYLKFWTTQESDLAGAVTDARRAALAQQYRSVTVEDPAVRLKFKQASEMVVETLITTEADALSLAAALLAIHKVLRDLFETPLDVEALDEGALDIMQSVRLTHSRFGLSGGRNFRILGRRLQLGKRIVRLSLWG